MAYGMRTVGGALLGAGKAAAVGVGGAAAMTLRQAATAVPGGATAVTAGIAGLGMIGAGAMKGFRHTPGGAKANGKDSGAAAVGKDGFKNMATLAGQQSIVNVLHDIHHDTSSILAIFEDMQKLAYEEARKRLKEIKKPKLPAPIIPGMGKGDEIQKSSDWKALAALLGLGLLLNDTIAGIMAAASGLVTKLKNLGLRLANFAKRFLIKPFIDFFAKDGTLDRWGKSLGKLVREGLLKPFLDFFGKEGTVVRWGRALGNIIRGSVIKPLLARFIEFFGKEGTLRSWGRSLGNIIRGSVIDPLIKPFVDFFAKDGTLSRWGNSLSKLIKDNVFTKFIERIRNFFKNAGKEIPKLEPKPRFKPPPAFGFKPGEAPRLPRAGTSIEPRAQPRAQPRPRWPGAALNLLRRGGPTPQTRFQLRTLSGGIAEPAPLPEGGLRAPTFPKLTGLAPEALEILKQQFMRPAPIVEPVPTGFLGERAPKFRSGSTGRFIKNLPTAVAPPPDARPTGAQTQPRTTGWQSRWAGATTGGVSARGTPGAGNIKTFGGLIGKTFKVGSALYNALKAKKDKFWKNIIEGLRSVPYIRNLIKFLPHAIIAYILGTLAWIWSSDAPMKEKVVVTSGLIGGLAGGQVLMGILGTAGAALGPLGIAAGTLGGLYLGFKGGEWLGRNIASVAIDYPPGSRTAGFEAMLDIGRLLQTGELPGAMMQKGQQFVQGKYESAQDTLKSLSAKMKARGEQNLANMTPSKYAKMLGGVTPMSFQNVPMDSGPGRLNKNIGALGRDMPPDIGTYLLQKEAMLNGVSVDASTKSGGATVMSNFSNDYSTTVLPTNASNFPAMISSGSSDRPAVTKRLNDDAYDTFLGGG